MEMEREKSAAQHSKVYKMEDDRLHTNDSLLITCLNLLIRQYYFTRTLFENLQKQQLNNIYKGFTTLRYSRICWIDFLVD